MMRFFHAINLSSLAWGFFYLLAGLLWVLVFVGVPAFLIWSGVTLFRRFRS